MSKMAIVKKKSSTQESLVPRLRFPEFVGTGDWVEKRLGDVCAFLKGKGISKSETNADGKLLCIRYGELYTLYDEVITEILTRTDLDADSLVLSQENDVLIPSSGETKIDIATAACVMRSGVALGGDLNILRTKQNGSFLSYYINGVKKRDIAKIAQGDTVVHLYNTQIKNIILRFPSNIEQQKIADCLSSLDSIITAQEQKIKKLEDHKKGIMQKLFPKQGENVPTLRFKQFVGDGEWEEKPLSSFSNVIKEKQGKNKFLLLSVTAGQGLVSQLEKFGREIAGEQSKNYYVVRKSDFAYNKSATKTYPEGYIALYENEEIGAVPNSIFTCFSVNSKRAMPKFLNYLFQKNHHGKWLQKYITVGARAHGSLAIDDKDVFALPVPLPPEKNCLPEQQHIADCLTSLDELITAHRTKLSLLKEHKKGLMQGLFPVAKA